MKKFFIGTIIMLCSFVMVSCGTNDTKTDTDSKNKTSSNSNGKIYFMANSSDDTVIKANWVTGQSNADALEEVKLKPPVTTNTSKQNTTQKTSNTETTNSNTTVSNSTTTTNKTPVVNNNQNNTQNSTGITPVEYYPKDETANPNEIISDPYDESSYTEEVDDKTQNQD